MIRKRFQKANSEGLDSVGISLVPRKVSARGHQGASSHDHLGDPQLGQQPQPAPLCGAAPSNGRIKLLQGQTGVLGTPIGFPLL